MISFKDILLNIVKELQEERIGFGRTKLIKLAYLLEIEYYRNNKQRLTSEQWVFFKFGPYIMNYEELLKNSQLDIAEEDEKGFRSIRLDEYVSVPQLTEEATRLIKRIVREFGHFTLNRLLDYVYFETEPMMNANTRQEVLRFDTVLPHEYYRIKKLKGDAEIKEKLRKKYNESIKNGIHL